MAKILTEEILRNLKKFDLPKGYQRTGEFPLDPSSVFASKADADLYAAGGADSRGLSGTRYAGQLIAVVENGVTTLYTVESNDTLKAVGGDVSADLATLTSRVDAILAGNHEGLDSLADVKAKFDSLKDLVVESGVVRVATEEELAADESLITGDLYIVLTIKNSNEKLFIPAKALVDVYTGSDYVAVSDKNVISLKITDLEAKLVTDEFAKKSDITDITNTLATTESVNAVKATADAAASKADVNEGKIGTLENTVGNAESGLVKDVADIKTDLTSYEVKSIDSTASNGVALELSEAGVLKVTADVSALATKESVDAISTNVENLTANLKVKDVNTTASNDILTIEKIDGSAITINLSDYATSSELENSLANKLNKIKVNNSTVNSTNLNIVGSGGTTVSNNSGTITISSETAPTSFDASAITSGTISLERLPKGALERLFIVSSENDAMRADCQEGDTVQVTGNDNKMYFCVNGSATTFANKFREYTAGAATSVPWSGVTGRPNVEDGAQKNIQSD